MPISSLSGAPAAAAAQPERDVRDHQPGGRRGLQVPRGGQGGCGGRVQLWEGERGNEQQWKWQRWGGRWEVYRPRLAFLCHCFFVVVIFEDSSNHLDIICRWFRGEQGEPGGASNAELDSDLGEEEQEKEQPVHPLC